MSRDFTLIGRSDNSGAAWRADCFGPSPSCGDFSSCGRASMAVLLYLSSQRPRSPDASESVIWLWFTKLPYLCYFVNNQCLLEKNNDRRTTETRTCGDGVIPPRTRREAEL